LVAPTGAVTLKIKEQDMAKDCELEIDVYVFGTEYQIGSGYEYLMGIAYRQASATHDVADIVDVFGNIDLTKFPDIKGYDQQTDITFNLKSLLTDRKGNPVAVGFAAGNDSISFKPKAGKEMDPKLKDGNTLVLANQNNDGNTFRYSLAVIALIGGDPFMTLPWNFDPEIKNKPLPPL
jgi:hypothetical protein